MVCEISQTGDLDLGGSVIVYLQEEILFESREAFDDCGSLYKVNVDGTRNEKVCDSEMTIPEGYAWVKSKYGEYF